ncbi:HDIG domain-containing protein [bacterium]|nr:HDIG domain-containing protein [bacterium]
MQVGQIAPVTVVSPRYVEFQSESDQQETEALRKRRIALVERVYSVDPVINKEVISDTVDIFTELRQRSNAGTRVVPPSNRLRFLSSPQLSHLRSINHRELDTLEKATIESIEHILGDGLREVDPEELSVKIRGRLKKYQMDRSDELIASSIIHHVVRPNLAYNESLTKKAQEKELNTIKPVTSTLKEGEPIFYKGEVVTQAHLDVLKHLNMYGRKANFYKFGGYLCLSVLLFVLLERFLYYFNRRIHAQPKYFSLIYFVILLVLIIGRFLQEVELFSGTINTYFFVPIPVAAMLVSLLITSNVSLIVCTVASVLLAAMYSNDFHVFAFLFLSACVSTFCIYKRFSRSELMVAGYIVGAFNVLFVLTFGLMREISDIFWFMSNMLVSFSTGVISSMITLAMIPYIEGMFNITTQQTLLELSNLNHPLLKRLMMTAPGTYQHSLMVANLAEAAAEAIHADPILSRVGAYYHDVGKMKRPLFFTENQFSGENPHSTLTPRMSKMVIASHPRDGVELATKYNLPQILKDFMMEHHGTSMVSFFYSQAMHTEDVHNPDMMKEEFRYPGPRPQFKESGIVMLADSVEAAVRSIEKPSPTKIENLVDRIFKDKIEDHQLAECPLSLKEIEIIKETFLRVFKGIYHSRIDYQEELDSLMQNPKLPNLKSKRS